MVSLKSFKLINETESDSPGETLHAYLGVYHQHQDGLLGNNNNQQQQQEQLHESSRNEKLSASQGYSVCEIRTNRNDIIESRVKAENNNDTSLSDQNNGSPIKRILKSSPKPTSATMMENSACALDKTSEQQQSNATPQNEAHHRDQKQEQKQKHKQQQQQETGSSMNRRAVVAVTLAPVNAEKFPPEDSSEASCQVIPSSDTTKPDSSPISSSISIVVVRHIETQSNSSNAISENAKGDIRRCAVGDNISQICTSGSLADEAASSGSTNDNTLPSGDFSNELRAVTTTNGIYQDNLVVYSRQKLSNAQQFPPSPNGLSESSLSVNTESEHFEIVWSNLSYRIEPKWHKRFNYIDQMLTYFMPGQTVDSHSSATSTASSSAGMNDNQHQMHASTNAENHLAPNAKQRPPSDPIEIFSNLNGTIRSGQMTAVLGPSGAGKTTLLNCLTGKLRKGVSGHINLKGANGKHLKMCTIPQKDHLLEQLTVEENLWFASKIKNPEYGFDHVKNIERVIDLLGLKRCRSAKIKKISGGQHKRVSIAQELLSNPDILVLDEPTSGLDSLTCFKTISMLRDLVELSANNDFMKPMAIIVTIHQPQPKVFNLFHHVYILANGGRVIYEGSPERSVQTITEVTSLQPSDLSKSASLSTGAIDPASFLIEIASEEYGIDVINVLSDYQRENFHQTRIHRGNFRVNEFNESPKSTKSDTTKGAKINQAFSPEFEHEKDACSEIIPAVLVVSNKNKLEQQQKGPTDMIKDSPSILGRRSVNGGSKKSSPKIKKRRSPTTFSNSGSVNGLKDPELNTSHNGDGCATPHDPNLYLSEQLLYTRVPNHKGRFWSHTATLTHRTLLTIRRDPLLMTSRVLFHLMIPILMGHVYGKATGAANACPHYEPEIDITQIPTLVESKRIEFMLEELHMSIENVSMFFIIMYAFAAAVLALNALSFPLNMQVLLKETRNGWYSMSSYVLAKTLADLPLELTMPCMTMLLVYPFTGQPSSYLQWRMLTICLIMTLCSLIAQTQALILGALVMNSVQTAVFVSQASQLPWVILAGFTIRIKRLSEPLKLISLTSFYRLGCEAITLTRYGFGICPCDPQEITGQPVKLVGIPDQLRTVAQYWIDSVEASKLAANETDSPNGEETTLSSTITTTLLPPTSSSKTDIFQHLANQLSYANSYGVNITSCDDVAPDRIRAINLGDNWLVARIWHLIIMLIIMKILLYYAVRFSIGIRL